MRSHVVSRIIFRDQKKKPYINGSTILISCIFSFLLFSASINTVSACTIFTAVHGDTVFFGNNEDFSNPQTFYWVIPPQNGTYGAVYFGFDDFVPQGGINEKGLAFDINALPETSLTPHPEKREFEGYEGYIILQYCATVEEAIEKLKEYNWGDTMWGQIHIADASGDAVVVSPGPDQEVSFTRIERGEGILISTNFNLASHPEGRNGICWRYDIANERLASATELSVEFVRNILDDAHVEGAYLNTLYSTVYDLVMGDVYVYYFHQFDEVVHLNVEELVKKNNEPVPLKDLFSAKVVERGSVEQGEYIFQDRLGNVFEVLGVVTAVGLGFCFVRKQVFFKKA